MDFKSLLQTMTSINEAETKVTKTGKVHKGDYGTAYDGDDEKKPAASTEKRGRGRPKKGADDSGEVKSYDTKSLGSVFGGGQKPKKDIGTVSKKHSLKEYMEAAEQALTEGDQIEIKPAQQNTQVIQQGNKTLGTVTNPQLANQIKQSIGKGEMTFNPEEEMSEEVDMGQADAHKPAKSGNEGDWDKNFREKLKQFTRDLEQHQAQKEQEGISEGKDEGKPGKNFAKIAKSAGQKYGSKAAGERVAGAVRNKLKAQGKLEEAKPDFLDVDKDSDKKESFKKALKDKEDKKKVAEGRDYASSEYTDEAIGKILAREKPGMDANSDEFYSAVYHELIQMGLIPKAARYKLNSDADFMGDVSSAYAHFQSNSTLDEDSIEDYTQHGMDATPSKFVAVDPNKAPTPFKVDPIQATTDRAINFISGLRKPSNPFSESTDMKDIQLESWESQLDSLLTEGITVSSSQGQQGAPDSVSVTASDNDAQQLMQVLRSAGIGGFGAGEEQPQADAYGVISQGEEEPTGTGTEPQQAPGVVGDGDDMLSLIKKMSGLSAGPVGSEDYEDEEGQEAGALEPTSGDEEGSDEQSSDDSDEEEQTDEGNAFTGKLAQTPKGGEFKMGDKSYKDNSSLEEGGFDPEQPEGGGAGAGDISKEENCSECGGAMYEGHQCDGEQVNEFANDAGGDAMGDAALMKLKALLTVGNDLHKMKTSQAMGNPVRVTESKQMINEWKKLSGI